MKKEVKDELSKADEYAIAQATEAFAQAYMMMYEGIISCLEVAKCSAFERTGRRLNNPTYRQIEALIDDLADTVDEIEPGLLEALSLKMGGSIHASMEMVTPILAEIGFSLHPRTAQELVVVMMQNVRRPN